MSDFEFLFALFGLMFGLIVAELAVKLADALDSNHERPIGILTPALAFLLLTDVTAFWLYIWGERRTLMVAWPTVFSGVLLATLYFIAASLVFPRTNRNWSNLDDHYWARKKVVAGAMLFVNLVIDAGMVMQVRPAWNDWWFYWYFPSYAVALAVLAVSTSRRVDLFFLTWAIAVNISAGFNLLPNSHFGTAIGLSPGIRTAPHH
jgi:cytochrome bd-type quinol oxidase subunit 2